MNKERNLKKMITENLFEKNDLLRNRDGNIIAGNLKKKITIQGIKLRPYRTIFHSNGKLQYGLLDGSQTVQGVKYLDDTLLWMDEFEGVTEGILDGDQFINGEKCKHLWTVLWDEITYSLTGERILMFAGADHYEM